MQQKAFPVGNLGTAGRMGSPPAAASIWLYRLNLIFSLRGGLLPPLHPALGTHTLPATHSQDQPDRWTALFIGAAVNHSHPWFWLRTPIALLYWPQNINTGKLLLWLRVDFVCVTYIALSLIEPKRSKMFFSLVYAILHLDRKSYPFWNKRVLFQDIELFKTNISVLIHCQK